MAIPFVVFSLIPTGVVMSMIAAMQDDFHREGGSIMPLGWYVAGCGLGIIIGSIALIILAIGVLYLARPSWLPPYLRRPRNRRTEAGEAN